MATPGFAAFQVKIDLTAKPGGGYGVGQATISEVLTKGYVPKVKTLFRLADGLWTSRVEVLWLAGHLPAGEALDPLERELVGLFLQLVEFVRLGRRGGDNIHSMSGLSIVWNSK